MDVKEVLDVAIAKETGACELYTATAEATDNPALKALLSDMAAQEDHHRELLQGIEPEQCGAFRPEPRQDLKLTEYLEERPLSLEASLQDVMLYAMHREEEAREFYASMADAVTDEQIAELFRSLATMEHAHKAKLEEQYEDIFLREN
ncbi:MAG: ferritin family protein [Planctomycetota bacterium]|jgi:rubrerythrin